METASCRAAGRSSPASFPECLSTKHQPIPGVTQPGTIQWLNPDAFVSTVDPSTGACYGGDSPQNCQFGNLGRNALRGPDFFWSDFYLTKWFPLSEHVKLRFEAPVLQRFQPSQLRASQHGAGRNSGKAFHADRIRSAHLHYFSADWLAGRRFGRRQYPRMIAFQARLEF